MNLRERKVYNILKELKISYKYYTHPAVSTIADIEEHVKGITVQHFKNLFLRNSKGDKHYLVLVDSRKKVNTKELARDIGSTRLSFASNDRLEQYLGLEAGAVSPLGLINDTTKAVEVLIDEDLKSYEEITMHPNVNTASITITYDDFEKFLNWCGNTIRYVEIS